MTKLNIKRTNQTYSDQSKPKVTTQNLPNFTTILLSVYERQDPEGKERRLSSEDISVAKKKKTFKFE